MTFKIFFLFELLTSAPLCSCLQPSVVFPQIHTLLSHSEPLSHLPSTTSCSLPCISFSSLLERTLLAHKHALACRPLKINKLLDEETLLVFERINCVCCSHSLPSILLVSCDLFSVLNSFKYWPLSSLESFQLPNAAATLEALSSVASLPHLTYYSGFPLKSNSI